MLSFSQLTTVYLVRRRCSALLLKSLLFRSINIEVHVDEAPPVLDRYISDGEMNKTNVI